MRPRARLLVVDGTAWPTAATRVLHGTNGAHVAARVVVQGAENARCVLSAALDLLIEDAAVSDTALVARGRGLDALVIIEGPSLARRVDALAVAALLSATAQRAPLVIAVCAAEREPALRKVLLAAGLDGDEAVMLAPHRADDDTTRAILEVVDARLARPRTTRLRAIAEGASAVLVGGEAPVVARVWALADDGFWPDDVVFPSAARAGDVIALPRPSWRAIDGAIDGATDDVLNGGRAGPPPCIAGRVVLEGDGPPRGAEVIVVTAGGESDGRVDESGALILERALPLPHGAALGVLVVRTGLRPGTPGALSARMLACRPHPTRAPLRRRPSSARDVGALFALHEATMRASVEATWGAWDADDQRRRFSENGAMPGRFQLVVAVDEHGAEREIVASYRVERRLHELVLASIEVAPAHQRRGIGSEIIHSLVVEADRAFARMTLSVLRANDRARDLYDRLGFSMIGSSATHFHYAMGPERRP